MSFEILHKENKEIKTLHEAGETQTAIAKTLDIPRSRVKRALDEIYGVSVNDIKGLSSQQILHIQKAVQDKTASQSQLAEELGVSRDTIRRALLVNVKSENNNVTVISPKTNMASGEYETEVVVEAGSMATIKQGKKTLNVYVATDKIYQDQFLCFQKHNNNTVTVSTRKLNELTPITDGASSYNAKDPDLLMKMFHMVNISSLADLSKLIEGGDVSQSQYRFIGSFETEYDIIVGDIIKGVDAKRRLGIDIGDGKVTRVALSKLQEVGISEKEEKPVDNKTKEDFSTSTVDDFLAKHQIMILPNSIVIAKDGVPHTIMQSHTSYDAIVKAIHACDIDTAYKLMQPREFIKEHVKGDMRVVDNKVYWKEYDITQTSLARRLLQLCLKGDMKNIDRLSLFAGKMYSNPSAALVQSGRIFDFMSYADIEIDEDGDILMYKSVRANYMDKHSGTIPNNPGNLVRMERSFVNDNNADLCSYGLHVCSLVYLKQCFGSLGQRVVRCKVNPKDIVSITNDFGSSKIRCCEYLVVDDYTTEYNRQYKSIDTNGLYK